MCLSIAAASSSKGADRPLNINSQTATMTQTAYLLEAGAEPRGSEVEVELHMDGGELQAGAYA